MSQPLSSLQFVTQTPLARMNSGQFQENQIRGNEFRANSGNVQSNSARVKEFKSSVAFLPPRPYLLALSSCLGIPILVEIKW